MENQVHRKDRILLLALALVVAFPFLGSFGLLEPDEGRFAQIGREMAATGDFLVPRLNGIEQFYKPPLVYWISAVGYRVFGVSEWTARLPSALAFAGVIWLTGWMGWRLRGRKVGWMAALILASMVEPYALGRQITLDMSLTFWITAALACLVEVGVGSRRRWAGYLFFVCMGLGFLAKGPMAWVVPLSAALVWGWMAKRKGEKLDLPWGLGIPMTFGVAMSWFVTVCWRYPELWKYFLGYELVERFASTTHGRSKPWWFFLPILLIGTVPWTGFLLGLIRQSLIKIKGKTLSPVLFVIEEGVGGDDDLPAGVPDAAADQAGVGVFCRDVAVEEDGVADRAEGLVLAQDPRLLAEGAVGGEEVRGVERGGSEVVGQGQRLIVHRPTAQGIGISQRRCQHAVAAAGD